MMVRDWWQRELRKGCEQAALNLFSLPVWLGPDEDFPCLKPKDGAVTCKGLEKSLYPVPFMVPVNFLEEWKYEEAGKLQANQGGKLTPEYRLVRPEVRNKDGTMCSEPCPCATLSPMGAASKCLQHFYSIFLNITIWFSRLLWGELKIYIPCWTHVVLLNF